MPAENPDSNLTPAPSGSIVPDGTAPPNTSPVDWPIIFFDTFDDNDHDWYIGIENLDSAVITTSIYGGKFHLSLLGKIPSVHSVFPKLGALRDFYAAVEVQKKSGPANADYGLIFRDDGEAHYFFRISADNKTYNVTVYSGGVWMDLINWKVSEQILPQGNNRIAVKAEGLRYAFYINGKEVDEMEDGRLRMGRIGGGITLYHSGERIAVDCDNIEVRAPEGSLATVTRPRG
jgi:hypothetical protein